MIQVSNERTPARLALPPSLAELLEEGLGCLAEEDQQKQARKQEDDDAARLNWQRLHCAISADKLIPPDLLLFADWSNIGRIERTTSTFVIEFELPELMPLAIQYAWADSFGERWKRKHFDNNWYGCPYWAVLDVYRERILVNHLPEALAIAQRLFQRGGKQ